MRGRGYRQITYPDGRVEKFTFIYKAVDLEGSFVMAVSSNALPFSPDYPQDFLDSTDTTTVDRYVPCVPKVRLKQPGSYCPSRLSLMMKSECNDPSECHESCHMHTHLPFLPLFSTLSLAGQGLHACAVKAGHARVEHRGGHCPLRPGARLPRRRAARILL